MITIETWTRNPEGTYDVTIVDTEQRKSHTYQFASQPIIHRLEELIRHQSYKRAFALVKAFALRSSGPEARLASFAEGRKRPDPVREIVSHRQSQGPEASPAETGWLFGGPGASPSIAPADLRRVMLYPF